MHKARYIKQKDKSSCGPIAILNILRWKGEAWATQSYLPVIKILCGWSKDGTYPTRMQSVMRALSIKYKVTTHLTLKEVDKHIDDGGIFLIGYAVDEKHSHYCLCIAKTKKSYTLVNRSKKSTSRCSRKVFRREILNQHHSDELIDSYFIRG